MNEKRNTLRILSGKPPLVTSFKCYFNWHTWTQWGEPIYREFFTSQMRSCIHCNSIEHKRL
jgi:hypothetical protein